MTRSHKRNNHIYLVRNTQASNDELWYSIYIALNEETAKRYALRSSWGKLEPWSDELYKALEVSDAGITKELASNFPVAQFHRSGSVEDIYALIMTEIKKILYVPKNRQKKSKTDEPLPDQISFDDIGV